MTLAASSSSSRGSGEMIREHWKKIGIDLDGPGDRAEPRRDARPQRAPDVPGTTTAPSTCSPSPATFSASTATSRIGPLLRQVVPFGRQAGQGAAAAHEGADGEVDARRSACRRPSGSSSARRSGRSPSRRCTPSAWSACRRRPGRPRRQEQHGQRAGSPVQQPGRQDAGHLAARDVLLQVVADAGI